MHRLTTNLFYNGEVIVFVSGLVLGSALAAPPSSPEPEGCARARVVAPTGRAPRETRAPGPTIELALDPLGGFLPSFTHKIGPVDGRRPITALADAPTHEIVAASLQGVDRIRTLEVQRSGLRDLSPLRDLQSVDAIIAYDTPLTSLEGVEHLGGLESIDVRGSAAHDLAPLAELRQLRSVFIDDTRVANLAPLRQAHCLEVLTASGTPVAKVGVLAKLPRLRQLSLDDTAITDVRPISRMTSLRELSLARTKVRDIRPLARLENLRVLSLAGTPVTSLRPLHSLTNLEELDITGADVDIEDVDALIDALPYTTIHTNVYRDIIRELGELERRTEAAMRDLRQAEAMLSLTDERGQGLALAIDVVRRLQAIGDFAATELEQANEVVEAARTPSPAK